MKKLLFGIVILLFIADLKAQLGGNSVFNSLNVPASSRAAALGGNGGAIKDGDLSLALYNPALLDSNMHKNLALSYVNYFSDVNFGFASYAHRVDSLTTLSGSVQFVDYGEFTERDVSGQELGTFTAGDYAIILGASRQIDSAFTVGANLKFLYSTIDQFSSSAAAVDLAASYTNKKRLFNATFLLRNIGTQFKSYTSDERESLPFDIQLGISKELKYAPLRFSIVADNLQEWDLRPESEIENVEIDPITGEVIEGNDFEFGDILMRHIIVGAEVLISDNLELRFGYNYRRRQELQVTEKPGTAGFSYGLSFRISRFHISYGRATYHLAGPSNTFTISTALAGR